MGGPCATLTADVGATFVVTPPDAGNAKSQIEWRWLGPKSIPRGFGFGELKNWEHKSGVVRLGFFTFIPKLLFKSINWELLEKH